MIILDPEGLFNGDRLRACSNEAQLHFHRLLLASNGFGRLELNYHRIIGRAYSTFRPPPSEADLNKWIGEYASHHLLFPYTVDGVAWGQWDTNPRFLPRYKSSIDRRSPAPPEQQYIDWKRAYLSERASFPKSLGNFTETFCPVVAVVDVGVDVKQQQQAPLLLTSNEWPATTAAVLGRFESCDGMFVMRLVQDSVQAAISNGLDGAEVTDDRLASIVRQSLAENFHGNGKGAGLLLKTVPQIIRNRAKSYQKEMQR